MKNKDTSQSDFSRDGRKPLGIIKSLVQYIPFLLFVLLSALALYVFFALGEMS